jgi:hypothetical protein
MGVCDTISTIINNPDIAQADINPANVEYSIKYFEL